MSEIAAVLAARDGVQATAAAVRERPDLIILDLGLPGGDGHVVAKRLRSNTKTMDIPVIVLTARNTREDMKRAHSADIVAYFTKPYRSDELMSAVATVFGTAAVHSPANHESSIQPQ